MSVVWIDDWELNQELGSLWLNTCATSRDITVAESTHDLFKAGRGPFHLYPGICFITEETYGKY